MSLLVPLVIFASGMPLRMYTVVAFGPTPVRYLLSVVLNSSGTMTTETESLLFFSP